MTTRRLRRLPRLLLPLAIACLAGTAGARHADDLATKAQAAVQASDWSTAAKLYGKLTASTPEDPNAWYQLGVATLRAKGDPAAARVALEKALELGFAPGPPLFAIAKSHAVANNSAASMDALDRLAENGPAPFAVRQLATDDAFASMRSNERFQGLVTRLTPCTSAEYRQFDFWLGSWDVFSPQGQQVGTNIVTSEMNGCVLLENWESGAGGKGMSLNYYDRDKGTWSQIYRDSSGNVTQWPELIGGLVKGAMVLETAPEVSPRSRWTWTLEQDGRVRQMAENSTDGGATWTVVWDSYYQRQKG